MDPAKMRVYGHAHGPPDYDERRGMLEVACNAFCSDYQENLAKALLLRNFAVAYLNKLLEKTEADIIVCSE